MCLKMLHLRELIRNATITLHGGSGSQRQLTLTDRN